MAALLSWYMTSVEAARRGARGVHRDSVGAVGLGERRKNVGGEAVLTALRAVLAALVVLAAAIDEDDRARAAEEGDDRQDDDVGGAAAVDAEARGETRPRSPTAAALRNLAACCS